MSPHPDTALSALLDGELDDATTVAVRTHLRDCAVCRATLAELEVIRGEARTWADAEVAPATDLWPGVLSRLDTPVTGGTAAGAGASSAVIPGPARWYQRRFTVGLPALAAAASLAAAVTGTLVWSRSAAPPAEIAAAMPIVADAEPLAVDASAVTPVSFADAQYDAAVGDLERVLSEQRDRLDPRTVIVLERNLRVIDDAIREAREALATDPANALLNAHLAGARRRKLDLLRRAALIEGN